MKPGMLLLALFILTASVYIVHAEENPVMLKTCQQEFIFPLTEEAEIPVTISNSLEEDVRGTLAVKIYESPDSGSAASYQRKAMSAFSGENTIYVPAGRSDEEKTILVDIAFEYGNSPAYSSVLSGIKVSFTVSGVSAVPDSGTARVTSKTEIQPSGTPADSYTYSGNDLNTLTEEYPDQVALRRTLLEEQIEDEFIRQQLLSTIFNDNLFKTENETFSSLNYSLSRINADGKDYGEGSFAWNYHTADRDSEVLVSGIIKNGEIVYITEKINNSILLPVEFNENATLKNMLNGLESDGFIPVETTINISSEGKQAYISMNRGIYSASVAAESRYGNITSLKMEKDNYLPFYTFPLIIIVLAVINASALYIYFSIKAERETGIKPEEQPLQNSNNSALERLDESEKLFSLGYRKEAVCSAARTLREWTSSEFFSGEELSDRRCIEFFSEYGKEYIEAAGILRSTEISRYAKKPVSGEEFAKIVEIIREIIKKKPGDNK